MGLHVVGVPALPSRDLCGSVSNVLNTGCAVGATMPENMAWSMSLRGWMEPTAVNGTCIPLKHINVCEFPQAYHSTMKTL